MASILVVDDDRLVRSLMAGILRGEGHRVEEAESGSAALGLLGENAFDAVLTDLKMPGMSGLDLLAEGRKIRPEAKWVLITAYGTVPSAVEAMRFGASDYLQKPLKSPDELRHVVNRVLREAESERKITLLSEELGKAKPGVDTLFLGRAMEPVRRLVEEVAPTGTTVLVTGQSGTGKELIARAIHDLSPRRLKPFVAVHCAALAENLLESELFGHEKGAFTGAGAARKGRFELADGSTLFLDEIGEISQTIQVKLLRILQERRFERVGGSKSLEVDVRVVSSTNRDLKAEMKAGRFREDLFYRLNVFPIEVPRLADRDDAILDLARYFVAKFSAALGRREPTLSEEAARALSAYRWPGNVRELQNVIERAVILGHTTIEAGHLNIDLAGETAHAAKGGGKQEIEAALAKVGGHREKAAKLLGISRRTLQYRLKSYGM